MKFLIIVLLFISCSLINCQQSDDVLLFQAFVNWMNNYNVYYTSGDMQEKFVNWKANLLKVNQLNDQFSNNQPEVMFSAVENSNIQTASMRELLAEPSISVSFPSKDVPQFELNEYSDLTEAEFSEIYTGADSTAAFPEAAAAAALLSTNAIIGIACGGGGALIGAAVVTAIVIKKKRASRTVKQSEISSPDIKMKPNGIDIMNHGPENNHKSITARAFYTQH